MRYTSTPCSTRCAIVEEMMSSSLKEEMIATTRNVSAIYEHGQPPFELLCAPVTYFEPRQRERLRAAGDRLRSERACQTDSFLLQYSERGRVERATERIGKGQNTCPGRSCELPDIATDLESLLRFGQGR